MDIGCAEGGRVRRLVFLLVALAALLPPAASAHPLGNFSVNRYSGIEVSGNCVYVHYVLDLAEIPTFQERNRVRRPEFAQDLRRGLKLTLDGRPAPLRLLDSKTEVRPGAGGLKTLRFAAVYETSARGTRLAYRDTNYASRLGWREVLVRAERGARIQSASVPTTSRSAELTAYPQDLLRDPLAVSSASATFRAGRLSGLPPLLGTAPAPEPRRGFESLINGELGAGAIFIALLLAAFWGAAHALTPGHGKAIVAGYLVGTRGRPRDAVALGLIVTATHTIGVFALGIVTLALSAFIVPEQLYPWLTLVSGLLVVGVGATVLWRRVQHRRQHAHGHHHHDHDHDHEHDHGYGRGGLLGVGVAAGLLPCPSALVVLLSAIALHRIGLGLALIVAFSVGLAATITAIGLVAVLARRAFSRLRIDGRLVRALPAASALAIVVVGAGITLRALPQVL
jgi:nickel/cobalt transporter (NicO) family protein